MLLIQTTVEFNAWLGTLDLRSQVRIVTRLVKLGRGLWRDVGPVDECVSKLHERFGHRLSR